MGSECHFLNEPGGHRPQDAQEDGQDHLQHGHSRHIHGHADTAEHMADAAEPAEQLHIAGAGAVDGLLPGNHPGHLPAELGVGAARGVQHIPGGKQEPKNPRFEETALVAHFHPLVEHHPAPVVQPDDDVSQLSPGHDHHAQVTACQGQAAAQFPGGDALGRGDAPDPVQGPGSQKQHPVQKRHADENQHGLQLRVALPDVDVDPGEHIRGYIQGHGYGLVVVELRLAGAGDHVAVAHVGQIRIDAGLPVGAGKTGIHGCVGGQHHHEGEVVHRIGKPADQGQLQLQRPLLGFLVGNHLHRIGDGIINPQGKFAHQAADHPAHIHVHGGAGFGGPGPRAVQGDVRGVSRQGEVEAVLGGLQPKGHGQVHLAVAVGVHGAVGVHPGGGIFRRYRKRQRRKQRGDGED